MFPLGFILAALGGFLIDSAVTNRRPVLLLEQIIGNPGNLRATLSQTRGTGYPSSVPSGGVSGSAALPGLLNPNGVLGAGPVAAAAIAWARAQIGKPYKWGATGPDAFDCSGLVQQAYAHAGVNLPRTTYQMLLVGTRVARANLQPGDLVFPDPGHVQIYTGNGNVIESPHTGLDVREVKMWGFMTARRVTHLAAQNGGNPTGPRHVKTLPPASATPPSYGGSSGLADIFGGNLS